MKRKTIEHVLNKKLKDWANSITDDNVKRLVLKNTIITGGAIASMLLKEPVNDYDIYFTNMETANAVANYYTKQFYKVYPESVYNIQIITENNRIKLRIKSAGVAGESGFKMSEDDEGNETHQEVEDESKPKYRPVFFSANAITLSDKIQLILRFYGDAATIHENFDFEHCKCYWTSKDKKLVTSTTALEALLAKELVYSGSKYPLASIIRSRKFINRGFTINAGQYLKMCLQLNDLDLRNLEVLEDQLTGVDALYFAQLLSAIPEDRKINGCVDTGYLITMINRFF